MVDWTDAEKRQLYAEMFGMGDIKVGLTITGRYPNKPAMQNLRPPMSAKEKALVEDLRRAALTNRRRAPWPFQN